MTTIANVEMAAMWDGEEGDDWTDNADRYDATDRYITVRFDAEVEIAAGDEVLDIGCGTGRCTRTAARRAAPGRVLGVDLSTRMLELARRLTDEEGLTNVEYVRADAQVHPFEPGRFDVAISVFGAMFFNDPAAALANVRRGLTGADARLALLAWQPFAANEWLTSIAGAVTVGRDLPSPPAGHPGPFGLADADQVSGILRSAGYAAPTVTPITEPMWLGADPDDAFAFVSGMGIVKGLTGDLDPPARAAAMDRLRALLEANATSDGVLLGSAAWLFTARPAAA